MKLAKHWLVIKADGSVRVRGRRPNMLGVDEIAVLINVNIPDGWAEISATEINITMPDPPQVEQDAVA